MVSILAFIIPMYVPPSVSSEPRESEYNSPPIATFQPFSLSCFLNGFNCFVRYRRFYEDRFNFVIYDELNKFIHSCVPASVAVLTPCKPFYFKAISASEVLEGIVCCYENARFFRNRFCLSFDVCICVIQFSEVRIIAFLKSSL